MARTGRIVTRLSGAAAVSVLLGGFGYLVARTQALPQGPQPIVWDKEACAHCRMAISAPAYAAQLQTRDGGILDFDDPGCLLAYVAEHAPAVHAIYFHAAQADRWLSREETAFLPVARTPMAYDLAAVPAGTAGALPYAAALRQVLAREQARRGDR